MKNAISIVKALTFGWEDHINQKGHNHVFHGGLVLCELLSSTIYIELGYNSDHVFIDATCSTNIPNTVTSVCHTISFSVEILPE